MKKLSMTPNVNLLSLQNGTHDNKFNKNRKALFDMAGMRKADNTSENMSKIAESVKGEDMYSPHTGYSNQGNHANIHAPQSGISKNDNQYGGSKQKQFEAQMGKNRQHGDQINSGQAQDDDECIAKFSDDDDLTDSDIFQNGSASQNLTLAQQLLKLHHQMTADEPYKQSHVRNSSVLNSSTQGGVAFKQQKQFIPSGIQSKFFQ